MPRYGRIDPEYATRLATCEPADDGPIYMLNLMKYRALADYAEDPTAQGAAPVSGREADDRYAPVDVLAAIGASICFLADVVSASEDWDRVAVVRYPTRRSFIEMQSRDDFKKKHVHKDAGMDHTTLLGTLPMADLPATAADRVLLEVWRNDEPPSAGSSPTSFGVEGTILGDGRSWTGVRYTVVDDTASLDSSKASPELQQLLLRPTIQRWS
jgi:hypothetical protein